MPQLIKAYRTKSTRDISLTTFVMFCVGVIFWLIYGILINSIALILANVVTLILELGILFLKLKYK